MTTPGVTPALIQGASPAQVALTVNQILRGKINATGTVTLAANAGSTTVSNALVSPSSVILLMPQTAHASAEQGAGTIYIDPANTVRGTSFVITNANNAQTDRTFAYVILG